MNYGDKISLEVLPTQPPATTKTDVILNIPTGRTCPICLTDYQTSEVISGCSQKHNFCKAYFTQYLEHLLSESKVANIVCPQDGCMETIKATLIEQLVSAHLFEKYKTQLQNLQDKTKLTCPKMNCQKRIKKARMRKFTVCKCGTQICNSCRNIWHKDKSCLQAINEELGEYSKNNETKLCMNCKSIVTKMEGCPHMSCPVCKYEWCWVCGRKFLPGHFVDCPKKWLPKRNIFEKYFFKFLEIICYIILTIFLISIALLGLAILFSPIIAGVISAKKSGN